MILEKAKAYPAGYGPLVMGLAGFLLGAFIVIQSPHLGGAFGVLLSVLVLIASALILGGLFVVNPNEARVLQLFGAYVGTAREAGLRWASPFYSKKRVSVRVRNFETGKLKVNDASGNPV